ncbi:MAG TPA: hypothetical protein VLJ21_04025 [Candidatus Binatia bacterium]|nr:hypothetical protein [Candidatus Binatia bacterium]
MKSFDDAVAAGKTLLAQPLLPVFSTILDALFLVSFGFVSGLFGSVIAIHAQNLVTVIGQQLQDAGSSYATPSMTELVFSSAARPYLGGVLGWLFLLAVATFVLYVLLEGTVWSLASNKPWKTYLFSFAKLNAVWFVVFGVLRAINDVIDLRSAFLQSITKTPGWVVPAGVRIAVLFIFLYFVLLSYAELRHATWWAAFKNAFGVTQCIRILPALVILGIVYLFLQFVLFPAVFAPLTRWSEPLALTLAIAILGPLAFGARLYIVKAFATEHGVHQQS